jgi:hypothetical protein
MLNALPTKGNLVYEYNPFRNYRLTENKYYYKGSYYSKEEVESELGFEWASTKYVIHDNKHILLEEIKGDGNLKYDKETNEVIDTSDPNNPKSLVILEKYKWIDFNGTEVTDIELFEKGQLVDFDTNELQFSLENPVHIIPQYSYDGSVNLILNDGYNPPRLINSRFSATGRNTYEIVDRKGNNDTNIYD